MDGVHAFRTVQCCRLLNSVFRCRSHRIFLNTRVSMRSFPAACCEASRQCQIYAENVENLMRLREPAAWVALAALVLNILLAVVGLGNLRGPTNESGMDVERTSR